MSRHPELRGKRLNAHCPYDEATLRQDMTYPDRGICPVCFTSLLKPVGADDPVTAPPGIMSGAVEGVALQDAVTTLDVFLAAYDSEPDDAIVNADDDLLTWGHLRTILASLTTPPARSYADGEWVLVPREITQAMLDATCATDADDAAMRNTWSELLYSAPKPPLSEAEWAVHSAIFDISMAKGGKACAADYSTAACAAIRLLSQEPNR